MPCATSITMLAWAVGEADDDTPQASSRVCTGSARPHRSVTSAALILSVRGRAPRPSAGALAREHPENRPQRRLPSGVGGCVGGAGTGCALPRDETRAAASRGRRERGESVHPAGE